MSKLLRLRTASENSSSPPFCRALASSQSSPPRRPSAPTLGPCLRTLERTPVLVSGQTETHAMQSWGPPVSDGSHRQNLTSQCLSPSCLLLPTCPTSPTRLEAPQRQAAHLLHILTEGDPAQAGLALENISCKMLGQQSPAVSICSPSLPTVHLAFLSPSLGDNPGWTLGCREKAERQGRHRVVTSSDLAVEPWAEWAMTNQPRTRATVSHDMQHNPSVSLSRTAGDGSLSH